MSAWYHLNKSLNHTRIYYILLCKHRGPGHSATPQGASWRSDRAQNLAPAPLAKPRPPPWALSAWKIAHLVMYTKMLLLIKPFACGSACKFTSSHKSTMADGDRAVCRGGIAHVVIGGELAVTSVETSASGFSLRGPLQRLESNSSMLFSGS